MPLAPMSQLKVQKDPCGLGQTKKASRMSLGFSWPMGHGWDLERRQVGDGNDKGITGERHNVNGVYAVEMSMGKWRDKSGLSGK